MTPISRLQKQLKSRKAKTGFSKTKNSLMAEFNELCSDYQHLVIQGDAAKTRRQLCMSKIQKLSKEILGITTQVKEDEKEANSQN